MRFFESQLRQLSSCLSLFLCFVLLASGCATQSTDDLKEKTPEQKKADLYYDYGTTALANGDYTKALTNLKKAIEIIDDDSRYHNNLGMSYYFKKDIASAIKHLKMAIDLDSKNSDAKNNLASIYFYEGKFDLAEKLYVEVTKDLEYTKQYRVYYNLGLLELQKGKKNKAISLFEKSIAENKSYCPAHFQMGMLSFENHAYHQAANSFENAALGNCADNPLPHYKQAESLANLGEYGDAIVKLEEIIEKFPKSKEAILATRKIKTLKVEKLRGNQEQALKYQLNQIEKKLREERLKKVQDEPAQPPKF